MNILNILKNSDSISLLFCHHPYSVMEVKSWIYHCLTISLADKYAGALGRDSPMTNTL
jgi:hypothetical protein